MHACTAPTNTRTPKSTLTAGAKATGHTVTVYVEQLRGGEIIWAGNVAIWDDNKQGLHGRRHPSGSCGPN